MRPWIELPSPSQIKLGGLIGEAVNASKTGRLERWITGPESPAIQVFLPSYRDHHEQGDWYGEHAGKWLIAASRAALRSGDEELAKLVREIGRVLVQMREEDGRISAYPPQAPARFDAPGAAKARTWDLWIQAYLMLGLLEASSLHPEEGFLEAATSVAESIAVRVETQDLRVRSLGNHAGLSATVILEPICRLGMLTGSPTLRALADRLIEELRPDLIDGVLEDRSIAEVGTGKIYQLLWNLVGIAAYGEWTGDRWPLQLVEKAWEDIRLHHLTPSGGPWGGVGKHKEVFNPRGFFSPYGMVETCSTWCWIQLSRELYRATGESRYLDAIEKAVLNQLLGAMSSDGQDWIYFSFPNGVRNRTYDWACCKSSGAAAWEEVAPLTCLESADSLTIGLYYPSEFRGERWQVRIEGDFPVTPEACIEIVAREAGTVRLRRPDWSPDLKLELDGQPVDLGPNDGWAILRVEAGSHTVRVRMGFEVRIEPTVATLDHHGQEIMRLDYFAVHFGPWSMATGLIDGYKMEETVRLAKLNGASHFLPTNGSGPELTWHRPDGSRISFVPYYLAGGREMGRWRTTWLQVAWQ